ncbi:MAG: FtsX-like permease family protein [Oenococcus sp.]|uniref:FtsX-like permease family protein n=1 Tax=Oenococcus sp. TaxID=1979414 RepID=UPI0039EA6C5A
MFYLKLASRNIRQSLSTFLPFGLSSIVMFVMNLTIASILFSPSLRKVRSASNAAMMLALGLIVLLIFATVFMIYSYRFLLKRRTKEFGLYNILGLKKQQIIRIAVLELFMMLIVTVVIGSALGVILAKFLYLILANILGTNYFNLQWSPTAIVTITIAFLFIYLLLMIISAVTIKSQSSLELLKNESCGEKEPKARVVLAFLGIIFLAIGYYMAVTVASPLDALVKFFIAVLFVIAGTFLFYVSFTIWLLKRRKKNKKYYYQPKHFITVSSMLYRMKQNAVGLANITILVTMTFVTLATTIGLYTSINGFLRGSFVRNTMINFNTTLPKSQSLIGQVAKENNIPLKNSIAYSMSDSLYGSIKQGKFKTIQRFSTLTAINFMTADMYTQLTGKKVQLSDNQAIAFPLIGNFDAKQITFGQHRFHIKEKISSMRNFPTRSLTASNWLLLIVNSEKQVQPILDQSGKRGNSLNSDLHFQSTISMDLSAKNAVKLDKALSDYRLNGSNQPIRKISDKSQLESGMGTPPNVMRYDQTRQVLMSFVGAFLFIGLILCFTFVLGTALIIYYKQISEGEQDKRSFEILQEVGLSKREVRQTIRSQVLLVFFMPIVVAVCHFAFAFVMIQKLLGLFVPTRLSLLLLTSAATIAVVALVYYLIFKQTSRVYYRLVER